MRPESAPSRSFLCSFCLKSHDIHFPPLKAAGSWQAPTPTRGSLENCKKLQKGEPRTFWFNKDGAEGVFLSVTEEEGRGG